MYSYRVLVADDETHARSGLQRSLSRHGFQVEAAANGLEAASRLRREHFDAVVADWRMPVIDGMNLLRFAKSRDQDIVFVLVSAYATPDIVVEAMKLGSSDVISKPFSPQTIAGALQRGLSKVSTSAERPTRVYRWPDSHMWVWPREDGSSLLGADAEFYSATGEVLYCDLPLAGEHVGKGERCATVTSAGSHRITHLCAPLGGVVLETNQHMEVQPWSAQGDPYGAAWLVRIAPTSLEPDLRGMTLEKVDKD